VKRESAPKPPQKLLDQVKAKMVVPLIGAGLSRSALPVGESQHPMPDYMKLTEMLVQRVDIRNEIVRERIVRGLEYAKKDPTQIDDTIQDIRKAITDMSFYKEIREVLEPIYAVFKPSLGHKLLRILNFPWILTTNYDRLLEKFVATYHEMFTARDLEAFRLFSIEHKRYFILKLHGDITRPDTIPFDLYTHYGLDHHGEVSVNMMITKQAQQLQGFLRQIFTEKTVLFLGSSMSENEGYISILSNLLISWRGLPHKHYALVPVSDNDNINYTRRKLSELGIEFIEYSPDSVHSQVWEFLAFLIAYTQPELPEPYKEWGKSYLPDRRADYLKFQLEREKTARSMYFFTPSLTNVIATDEDINGTIRNHLTSKRIYSDDQIEEIINIMRARKQNLENRLELNKVEVRVLFLETELRDSINNTGDPVVGERYRHLLKLMDAPGLHVRLIPEISADHLRDKHEGSYGLIFNQTTPQELELDVTIAYASQANKNFFDIHLIQINTCEVKERVYQFERFWGSAIDKNETKEIIQNIINKRYSP